MSHFQNQYSAPEVSQTDALGNPVRRTDDYGNQIPTHESTDRGILGLGGHHQGGHHIPTHESTDHGILGLGGHHQGGHHGLQRSGSSSSSSSEDEGTGRKKKGLKEKLKEKIPGGRKEQQSHATSTTTPGQGPIYHQQGEKKGVMDKIKEKLPGGNH